MGNKTKEQELFVGVDSSSPSADYYKDPRMSQSRLKAWLKCPNFYQAKHIDKIIPNESTPAMLHGSLVDAIITQPDRLEQEFVVVERRPRGLRVDEFGRTFVNPREMALAEAAAQRVTMQPVMRMFTQPWMKTQVAMYTPKCKGLLDFFGVDPQGVGWIVDLKTLKDTDKIFWDYKDWDWAFQLTYYRMLAKELHPEIKRWKIFIIGVDKTKDQKFTVKKIPQTTFNTREKYIKNMLILVGKNIKISKGRCLSCPPEVDCKFSKFDTNHIKYINDV